MEDRRLATLIEAIRAVHDYEVVGGCLHIAIDDGNLSRDDLLYCAKYLAEHEDETTGVNEQWRCLGLLLAASYRERVQAYEARFSDEG